MVIKVDGHLEPFVMRFFYYRSSITIFLQFEAVAYNIGSTRYQTNAENDYRCFVYLSMLVEEKNILLHSKYEYVSLNL